VLKTREFTVEIEKIHAGENPLRLEGENKGIAEPAESISRIGLINPVGYIYSYRARMRHEFSKNSGIFPARGKGDLWY